MSINSMLIAALHEIAPTEPDVYTGEATTYIVFSYSVVPSLYADNEPQCRVYLIQVHYFCPVDADSLTDRGLIRTAIHSGGFGWPDEDDKSDSNGQHHIFTCEWIEGIGNG